MCAWTPSGGSGKCSGACASSFSTRTWAARRRRRLRTRPRKGLDELLLLGRHVLPLLGEEAPADEAERLAAFVRAGAGDPAPLVEAYGRLHDGERIPRPLALLDALGPVIARLVDRVDAIADSGN